MGERFVITYHEAVSQKDLPKLSSREKKHIREAIKKKLTTNPELFGKPLRHSLKGHRTLRVGDFRIVFRIKGKIIKIQAIKHRSKAYKNVEKRLDA